VCVVVLDKSSPQELCAAAPGSSPQHDTIALEREPEALGSCHGCRSVDGYGAIEHEKETDTMEKITIGWTARCSLRRLMKKLYYTFGDALRRPVKRIGMKVA
jgi:hypothetical protein